MAPEEILPGLVVRWSNDTVIGVFGSYGGTFTARVTGPNGYGGFRAEVVDPGDYNDSEMGGLSQGQIVPNLRPDLVEVA